jgi:hypothetical protein
MFKGIKIADVWGLHFLSPLAAWRWSSAYQSLTCQAVPKGMLEPDGLRQRSQGLPSTTAGVFMF